MQQNTNSQIPYYAVDDPFDIVYRNSSSSHIVLPHIHNALEIYFSLTDLPDVLLNDAVSSVPKGSLIVIPPYNAHQLFNQRLTVYERYIVSINSDWLQVVFRNHPELMEYADRNASPLILPLSESNQALLTNSLQFFLTAPKEFTLEYYAAFFQLLKIIDSMITKNLRPERFQPHISKSQELVNEIITYINLHLTEEITLDCIADHFFMNKDYLGRLFKKHTQATIGHYIALQRVSMAQLLLTEGHSVTQVQEALGFSSYTYFFKFFKKMTGISPSHYRKDNMR